MTGIRMVPTTRKKKIPSTVRSAAQWDGTNLRSINRAKGVMMLDLDLDLDSDSTWETELENMQIRAWIPVRPPRPSIYPRTASRSPNSAQSMASSNANVGGSPRLLGHGRAPSINRAAAAGAPQRTKPRLSTTTATRNTCVCICCYGILDPLVVRPEENEARTEATPSPML
jgi:hypothetical protein